MSFDQVVCLSQNSRKIYPLERYWFLDVPFGSVFKIQSLAQFQVDHFSHPVVSTLLLLSHATKKLLQFLHFAFQAFCLYSNFTFFPCYPTRVTSFCRQWCTLISNRDVINSLLFISQRSKIELISYLLDQLPISFLVLSAGVWIHPLYLLQRERLFRH